MNIRIYLVSVEGLENSKCFEEALTCLDQTRALKVCSYKRQKDQCLAVATGLLLQVAYQGILPGYQQNEKIEAYSVKSIVELLLGSTKEIKYHINEYGKPYWDCNIEGSQFFSISHSGNYVMIACSNVEIGIDLQEEKQFKGMKHSISTFSKMESYVKCMGTGFSGEGAGVLDYLLHEKNTQKLYECKGIEHCKINTLKDYVAWICMKKDF